VVTERRTYRAGRAQYLDGAAISPDGSHVVFATYDDPAISLVDTEGGPAEVLFKSRVADVYEPAFSPDGAKIAFVAGGGDSGHRVWVMDADGSDAHQILANETTMSIGHVDGLAWSPAGDRLAISLDWQGGIYTFATDGSGFTRAPSEAQDPLHGGWYWSPDGSQLVSGPWHPGR
jgi:WD40 repeat protein